jgi:hypothetical protein
MDLERAQAQMDAATKSAKEQMELDRTMVDNQLDAGDRILMRKAADSVLQLSQMMALTDPDPT